MTYNTLFTYLICLFYLICSVYFIMLTLSTLSISTYFSFSIVKFYINSRGPNSRVGISASEDVTFDALTVNLNLDLLLIR